MHTTPSCWLTLVVLFTEALEWLAPNNAQAHLTEPEYMGKCYMGICFWGAVSGVLFSTHWLFRCLQHAVLAPRPVALVVVVGSVAQ